MESKRSRCPGSRIQALFDAQLEQRELLRKKKRKLKAEIAKMLFDKQNFLRLSAKLERQKEEITRRTRALRAELGEQLDSPLDAQTERRIAEAGAALSKQRRKANAAHKATLKQRREATRAELLADPEYQVVSEAEVRKDVAANLYPATLEFARAFRADAEIQILRSCPGKNLFAILDAQASLRVLDWGSLRVLGLARVASQRRVLELLFQAADSEKGRRG